MHDQPTPDGRAAKIALAALVAVFTALVTLMAGGHAHRAAASSRAPLITQFAARYA